MAKVHIGKKIREVVDRSPITIVGFAKSVNLTRDGVYKILKKETISIEQLLKISKVLNHDFLSYYHQNNPGLVKESKSDYGNVTRAEMREEIDSITRAVLQLAKAVEKIQEQLPGKKSVKKKSTKK